MKMLHRMTGEEIAIQKIDRLRMISVYEFTDATKAIDDGNRNMTPVNGERPFGCMAVTVFYGENEQITLSEMDTCFDRLVDRLFYLYSEDANKADIMMDASTRKLFETGRYSEEESFQNVYAEKTGQRLPRISFDTARSQMLIPLAEYLFTEICGFLEREETVSERLYGWHGNGMLIGIYNGTQTEHPIILRYSGGSNYTLTIGDFPKQGENMRVDIMFKDAQLDVTFVGEMTDIVGSFVYNFDTENMRVDANVFWEQKPICYETKHYRSVKTIADLSEAEKQLLPEGMEPTVIYHLPWNMMYISSLHTKTLGDIVKTDVCGTYLFPEARYAETCFWTRVVNRASRIVLRINSADTRRLIMKDGTVQTYFADNVTGASGRYRNRLAGRYFFTNDAEPETASDNEEAAGSEEIPMNDAIAVNEEVPAQDVTQENDANALADAAAETVAAINETDLEKQGE